MIGAARGYRVILTMPESMSIERRKLLKAYGAELVLTAKEKGMKGAVEAAERARRDHGGRLDRRPVRQPRKPADPLRDNGTRDLGGTGRRRGSAPSSPVSEPAARSPGSAASSRRRTPAIKAVAVEPAESPIISQRLAGEDLTPGPHLIQGIGANFIPSVLDLDMIDEVQQVSGDEAIATARLAASEEGLLVGISSGANIAAALRLAALPEYAGKFIVTPAPSTGERYLTTKLWEELG